MNFHHATIVFPQPGRVIYYARTKQDEIWLLTLYAKNVAENIPSHVLRQIKKEIDDEKDKSS